MLDLLKQTAKSVKKEIDFYRLVAKDPRTPPAAKWMLGAALGYLLLPFDLIPDWLPVVGALDDIVIVSSLVLLAMRRIPPEVQKDCRAQLEKAGPPPAGPA